MTHEQSFIVAHGLKYIYLFYLFSLSFYLISFCLGFFSKSNHQSLPTSPGRSNIHWWHWHIEIFITLHTLDVIHVVWTTLNSEHQCDGRANGPSNYARRELGKTKSKAEINILYNWQEAINIINMMVLIVIKIPFQGSQSSGTQKNLRSPEIGGTEDSVAQKLNPRGPCHGLRIELRQLYCLDMIDRPGTRKT